MIINLIYKVTYVLLKALKIKIFHFYPTFSMNFMLYLKINLFNNT